MYSVPEPPNKNESISSERKEKDSRILLRGYTAGLGATLVILAIAWFVTVKMLNEDEIKLHVLDAMIKFFQAIARAAGGAALQCEKAYNDYVDSLHG